MSAVKRFSLILAIILTAVILVSGCGGGGGGTVPTPTPTDTGTPGPTTSPGVFSFIETFNSVPDGTNIRPADAASRTTMLDNPESFLYDNFGGSIWAGRTIGGTGTIGMDNGTATTQGANGQRMAFVVPGLDAVTSPVLRLRIKNDNGSGSPVSSLMIYVGNSFGTSGNVGVAGQRAYGQWTISSAAYTDVDIPLSTSFTSTNIIQIRPVVSGSSTGAAGIYIDRIEVTGTTGASPTPTPTGSATPTPTPTGTPRVMDVSLIGFATLNNGTNGGYGGTSVTVSTGTELQAAIDAAKPNGPRIIYINGTITLANSPGLSKIDIKDVNNISIFGVGASGELNGIGIKIWRAHNIVIRNLKIHHVLASTGDGDCIGIVGPSSNIWIDHCELYNTFQGVDKDYYDALLDIKEDSEYITVSWVYFHDSWKSSLVGYTTSDTYDRKITYHHNYFNNCNSRMPSYRGGTGHIFNNYYNAIAETGINCRLGAVLRIEYNYFENSKDPIGYWQGEDTAADTGYWHVNDNLFTSCTGSQPTTSTGTFVPPYSYSPHMVADVKSVVLAGAGVGIIVPSSSRVKPAYRK